MIGLIAFMFFNGMFSQATVPLRLSWDTQVGCQNFTSETDRFKTTIFLADIVDGKCLRICENSRVTYKIVGNVGSNPLTVWTVVGGVIVNETPTSVVIDWGIAGEGSLAFDLVSDTFKTKKTICIEIMKGPTASFTLLDNDRDFTVCANVPVNFINNSTANGGAAIVSYYWSFRNLTTNAVDYSNAESPTYTFSNSGTGCLVKLVVTNGCNCIATFEKIIYVKDSGIEILYPSVVCENGFSTYNVRGGAANMCTGSYFWSVSGGVIVNDPSEPEVQIKWNQVGSDGFGYVTFNPANCNVECSKPTTIKIPIVKQIGTIQGSSVICKGVQSLYKLPQWPTTNFTWTIDGNAGTVVPSDQRNEVYITPTQSGTITLRALYQNTLLHCTGTASIVLTVKETITFLGNTVVCLNQNGSYSTQGNIAVNWTLKNPAGLVLATLPNSSNFSYNSFNVPGEYQLFATGPNICDNQKLIITVINGLSTPIIDNPKLLVCPNDPIEYKILNPEFPTTQYEWTAPTGTFVGSNLGFQVTVKFNSPGPISVKRVSGICNSLTTTHNVVLEQINAGLSDRPSFDLATNMSACQSTFRNYSAVNNIGPLGQYAVPDSSYEWSIVPSSAGSITSGQGSNNVQVLWNNVPSGFSSINASLRCTIKKCTLSRTAISTVTVYSSPSFTVVAPNSVCSGNGISFSLTPPLPAGSSVLWTFSDGSTFTAAGDLPTPPKVFYNGSTSNANYTVTASFSNAFGCPGFYTASKNFEVTPGPLASLTASGNTTFCGANTINTVLTPNFAGGATITWYNGTMAMSGATGNSAPFFTSANSGFGEYYFIANLNGCSNRSNSVYINQNCGPGPSCNLPTPAMTLVYDGVNSSSCRVLSLTGTAAGNPTNTFFTIQGPNFPLISAAGSGISPSTISRNIQFAGIYNCTFNARYSSVCTFTQNLDVAVPYVPYFFTNVVCNANNTFNISLLDGSSIMAGVSNINYLYYYRLVGSSSWLGPVSPPNGTTTATLNNLPQGNYEITQSIQGTYNGAIYPACETMQTRNLVGFANQTIVFNQPSCFDDVVNFSTSNPQGGNTYLWSFPDTPQAVTNFQPAPGKVFNSNQAGTSVEVKVTVTNIYGCQMFLSTTVNIPTQCFRGRTISDPAPPNVCKGQSVLIKYEPIGGTIVECTPDQYVLMNNTTQVAVSTTNNFTVTTPGSYWIKVINNNPNGTQCVWNTTQRITPAFVNPPSIKLDVPAFKCASDALICSVQTDPPGTVTIRWFLDNVLQPSYNNMVSFQPATLAPGVYNVKVVITNILSGCAITDARNVEILLAPTSLTIANPVLVNCDSYEIQLSATANQAGTYMWSNGMAGATITVYTGGPYKVTFTNAGGCSQELEIDVPRKPDHYMWIYPQGLYELCQQSPGSLIGPNLIFNQWDWQFFGSSVLTGFNSKPTPFVPSNDGTYNLELNSGLCPVKSPDMYVSLVNCELCIKAHTIQSIVPQSTPYCSYVMNVILDNDVSNVNLSFISPTNQVMVSPSVYVPINTSNSYALTIIPINGYIGIPSPITIQAVGVLSDGQKCYYEIELTLPLCLDVVSRTALGLESVTDKKGSMVLFPNPAQSQVTVQFESIADKAVIEVYDLTGRLVATHKATALKEEWQMDLNGLQAALYVVVMKENGKIVMQRKLEVVK